MNMNIQFAACSKTQFGSQANQQKIAEYEKMFQDAVEVDKMSGGFPGANVFIKKRLNSGNWIVSRALQPNAVTTNYIFRPDGSVTKSVSTVSAGQQNPKEIQILPSGSINPALLGAGANQQEIQKYEEILKKAIDPSTSMGGMKHFDDYKKTKNADGSISVEKVLQPNAKTKTLIYKPDGSVVESVFTVFPRPKNPSETQILPPGSIDPALLQ